MGELVGAVCQRAKSAMLRSTINLTAAMRTSALAVETRPLPTTAVTMIHGSSGFGSRQSEGVFETTTISMVRVLQILVALLCLLTMIAVSMIVHMPSVYIGFDLWKHVLVVC